MQRAHAQVRESSLGVKRPYTWNWDFRDGEDMRDPFGERRGKFQWKVLGEKLAMLRENNPQWFAEVRFESSN